MDLDVALERALRILEPQIALTAAEQRHEDVAEILAHADERLQKELARGCVDLPDCLRQRMLRRIQVVALRSQEAKALLFLLVLFNGERINRPERVELVSH